MKKTTLVIGASENPERYAYKAVQALLYNNQEVVALGRNHGQIGDIPIHSTPPSIENVDTISLYLGPQHQANFEEYILHLAPRRVLFNPGTENAALEKTLEQAGILTERACTLVLLSTNQY